MSGQRKNCSEYKKQMNEYLRTHNPYGPHEPCDIDLRALNNYMKENHISNTEVTPELAEMFKLHK